MLKNVGSIDKVVRYIAGILIIGLGLYYGSWWGAIGLIPIGTALVGTCPAYLPFGLSSCKTNKAGR